MSAEYEAACEIREALNELRWEVEALLPSPRVMIATVMLHAWVLAHRDKPSQADVVGAFSIADAILATSGAFPAVLATPTK